MWGQVRAGGEAGFTTCDKISLQLLLSSDASSAIVIASRCTPRHNCDVSQRSTTHILLCLRRSTTHLFLCPAPPPAHLTFSPPCLGFMSRDLPSPRLPPLNNHTRPHNCLHSIATCVYPTAFRWCLFLSRLSVVAPPLALIRCGVAARQHYSLHVCMHTHQSSCGTSHVTRHASSRSIFRLRFDAQSRVRFLKKTEFEDKESVVEVISHILHDAAADTTAAAAATTAATAAAAAAANADVFNEL